MDGYASGGSREFAFFGQTTPMWYMLIAITPRVRYRWLLGARCTVHGVPYSRCPAWRTTEFRQLCANLLNSNLTGSHLPPLVRPYTLYSTPCTRLPSSRPVCFATNWIISPSRDIIFAWSPRLFRAFSPRSYRGSYEVTKKEIAKLDRRLEDLCSRTERS